MVYEAFTMFLNPLAGIPRTAYQAGGKQEENDHGRPLSR